MTDIELFEAFEASKSNMASITSRKLIAYIKLRLLNEAKLWPNDPDLAELRRLDALLRHKLADEGLDPDGEFSEVEEAIYELTGGDQNSEVYRFSGVEAALSKACA